MGKPGGAIVWQGTSPIDGAPIVLIVTGLQGRASANSKTGDMVQSWILRADMSPTDSLPVDADRSICGDCVHRGTTVDGKRVKRSCYVNLRAPQSVYRAFVRGSYPVMSPEDVGELIAGKAIRLGSYGDPGLVPVPVLLALIKQARLWTGYTHQWRTIDTAYAGVLMASADSVEDRRQARGMGYRTFYVLPRGGSLAVSGAMECASTRERAPRQCADCGACAGTRMGAAERAVDVVILAHGIGAKYVA